MGSDADFLDKHSLRRCQSQEYLGASQRKTLPQEDNVIVWSHEVVRKGNYCEATKTAPIAITPRFCFVNQAFSWNPLSDEHGEATYPSGYSRRNRNTKRTLHPGRKPWTISCKIFLTNSKLSPTTSKPSLRTPLLVPKISRRSPTISNRNPMLSKLIADDPCKRQPARSTG